MLCLLVVQLLGSHRGRRNLMLLLLPLLLLMLLQGHVRSMAVGDPAHRTLTSVGLQGCEVMNNHWGWGSRRSHADAEANARNALQHSQHSGTAAHQCNWAQPGPSDAVVLPYSEIDSRRVICGVEVQRSSTVMIS